MTGNERQRSARFYKARLNLLGRIQRAGLCCLRAGRRRLDLRIRQTREVLWRIVPLLRKACT